MRNAKKKRAAPTKPTFVIDIEAIPGKAVVQRPGAELEIVDLARGQFHVHEGVRNHVVVSPVYMPSCAFARALMRRAGI